MVVASSKTMDCLLIPSIVLCSMTGGIRETQEMLDFCGKHNIVCKSEVIGVDYVNTAYERLMKNDVYYRFVIDIMGSLLVN